MSANGERERERAMGDQEGACSWYLFLSLCELHFSPSRRIAETPCRRHVNEYHFSLSSPPNCERAPERLPLRLCPCAQLENVRGLYKKKTDTFVLSSKKTKKKLERMRANATTTLLGRSALLVPYSAGHVEAYHSWMEDIGLREATASERLTLEEEREMQRSWAEDDASALFFFSSSFALSLPPPSGRGTETLTAKGVTKNTTTPK